MKTSPTASILLNSGRLFGMARLMSALLMGALCQSAMATVYTVNIDLDSPSFGGTGGSFIRYDYTFEAAAGSNELVLSFINNRQLELTGLDAVRMGFFPSLSSASVQFGDGLGGLIGPSFAMTLDPGGDIIRNEAMGSFAVDARSLHLYYTAGSASGSHAGAIVFAVGNIGGGSIAIGNAAVPEAGSSLTLLGLGLVALAGMRQRSKQA
ncbi:MAG: hypothetical protein IAF94_02640 [Pirellulaceae bacterium]|nr:hypothetical protein [Pirellulaceae bacterium]